MLIKSNIEKTEIKIPKSFFLFSGEIVKAAGSDGVVFFFRLVAIIIPDKKNQEAASFFSASNFIVFTEKTGIALKTSRLLQYLISS